MSGVVEFTVLLLFLHYLCTLFSSLYRAIEQYIEVIRPTICTRVFFVLKSLQF